MNEKIIEHGSEPGFWVGRWQNVAIQLWGGDVAVRHINSCEECHRAIWNKHPDQLVTFAVILPSANPRIGAVERERLSRLFQAQKGTLLAAAQVVEGSGFWASTARAVLTGLNMLTRTRQKVFVSEDAAAEWLTSIRVVSASSAEFLEAIREARTMFIAK